MRYVVIMLMLVVLCVGSVPTQADTTSPLPSDVTMGWLRPGILLVRWQQNSSADKTDLMRCRLQREDECVVYTQVFDHIPGWRYAAVAAQPNDPIRLAEYGLGASAWQLRSWSTSYYAPGYEVQVPVVMR